MLVNQTLLYSVSNNTNNIRFKLDINSFNAGWKKAAQGSPLSLKGLYLVRILKKSIFFKFYFRNVQ